MSEMTEDKVNELITSALANYAKKIELRVVSDEKGNIDAKKGTIQAKDNDMYTFYVQEKANTGIPVKMVLPVGGEISGLYRFPRVGEKVLVQLGGGTDNYLLGYVPDETDKNQMFIYDEGISDLKAEISDIEKRIDELLNKTSLTDEEKTELKKLDSNKKRIDELLNKTSLTDKEKTDIKGYLDSKITKENDLALKKTAYDSQCAKLLDSSKGMVLRYQQTGKKPDKAGADEKYSEIGFYSQPTSWKANKDKEDYRAFGTDEKSKDFPKIDRINIKSTGDIYSDAVNYQGIRANRMEISVGKGKTLGAKAKRGVLSIEAGDEIELKSDTKITLTVGKSSITIDDTGIYLATNKVTGPYSSAWETMLNLTPADGIMGGGSRVKFNAVNEVQLAEGYGGSFAAHLGVTRIGGLDIKLATENILEYGVTKLGLIADTVINGVILAAGIIAEGVAITADIDKQKNKLAAIIGLPSLKGAGVIVKSSVSMADKKMAGEWASLAGENDQPYKDSAGALSGAVSIAVQIASAIATVLSFTVPKWFEGQDKAAEKANLARSSINMALLATETGLSLAVVSAMVAQGAASVKGNAVSEDTFHLQFGGMIHNESYNNLSISTEQRNYKNPLAGFDLKGFKPMGKQPLIQMFTKLVKPVMLACQKAGVFNNKELENL